MKTFIQPEITGFRPLNKYEVSLMDDINEQWASLGVFVACLRSNPTFDQRCVSVGANDLQAGLMALARGVAQTTTP